MIKYAKNVAVLLTLKVTLNEMFHKWYVSNNVISDVFGVN